MLPTRRSHVSERIVADNVNVASPRACENEGVSEHRPATIKW
jgi:hypothetical protein